MLAFYQRWSRRLYPLRPLFVILCLTALMVFVWLLFAATPAQAQRWQLSTVLVALSGSLLWLWASVFYRPLPALPDTGLMVRLKIRLLYLLNYLLCVLISVLLLATLYLGLRVLKGIIAILFFS